MNDVLSGLLLYPTFRELPRAELEATGPLWGARHLNIGERLWKQDDPADGLAVVLRGEVEAVVDEVDLGRIGNGGIVGEVSAFVEGSTRTATVVATLPVDVALLTREALLTLRESHTTVYDAVLQQCLRALVRRVRAADRRISALARGDSPMPTRHEPGALARMWRSLVPGLPRGTCPPLVPLLRRQPALADAPDAILAAIAVRFTPEALPEGHVLCLEGEESQGAWIIAEGAVDVLRQVRAERAERIATMGPGDLLGVNTLVEPTPRTASCLTARPTWVWALSVDAMRQIRGGAGLYWEECILHALAAQIRLAHRTLSRVAAGGPSGPPPGEDFDRLLHAQGYLEGLPIEQQEAMRPLRTSPSRLT